MPIDDNSILQADATVIAGVLILLTIATLGDGLETRLFSNLFTLFFTVVAIFPFAISAMFIIDVQMGIHRTRQENIERDRNRARSLTVTGFVYLLAVVIMIVGANVYELLGPTKTFNGTRTTSSVAMHCTQNPTAFNVTHLSQCSKFTPGSIAEDCAASPKAYELELSQCTE